MSNVNVSVTCQNCGSTVVLNLQTSTSGGFSGVCHSCGASVSGSYGVDADGSTRIYSVRSFGGMKRR